jgi:hypothetical protein
MSRHDWHTVLTLAGAVAEAVGVILVVFDLQGARKTAKALLLIPVGASLAMPFNVGEPAACQDYDLFVRLQHPSQRILAVIAPSGDGDHRNRRRD